MLPQRDLISWKSKASIFPLGNKSTCSQRLNPILLLRPQGEGEVIPTDLNAAFRIIPLVSLSTQSWLCVGCVCVEGMGDGERRRSWCEEAESPWDSLRPHPQPSAFTGSGQRPRGDVYMNPLLLAGEGWPAPSFPSTPPSLPPPLPFHSLLSHPFPQLPHCCPLLTQDPFYKMVANYPLPLSGILF